MNKRLVLWLPVFVWAAGIFLLSALSNPPIPGPVFPLRDKIGHFGLYFVLGCLLARALRPGRSLPKTLFLAALLTSAYGVTDEFHQRYVPHRTCDVFDWLADTLGGCVAVAVYSAYESAKANRRTA